MSRWLMAAVVMLVLAGEARGEWTTGWTTGNDLHRWCSSDGDNEGSWEQAVCSGYIIGVADEMVNSGNPLQNPGNWAACIPVGVSRLQIRDIAARHIDQHPEFRHLLAHWLVERALAEAFPCE